MVTKHFLANGVITLFINSKLAVINGIRKIKNPPYWLIIFLIVPLIKCFYFVKTFIMSFISSLVKIIPVPWTLSEGFFKPSIKFLESTAAFYYIINCSFFR